MPASKSKSKEITGPAAFQRDEHGLLTNTEYHFYEDGSVNWRSMIKDEHLFPNRDHFKTRNLPVPRTIEGLKDHQLLIKLSGIKELARLRGFSSVSYKSVKCEEDHVAVVCEISFLPNYETGHQPVVFQDMANATINNTSDFGQIFLETIACNRAFVRCVRNFLNIHIVGDDEINKNNGKTNTSLQKNSSPSGISASEILKTSASNKMNCTDFSDFKQVLRDWWREDKYRHESASQWEDWGDIPPSESRLLLKLVNG